MNDIIKLRVARPTDNLAAIKKMYLSGLGLKVLAEFGGHGGFDGVVLGHPNHPYHFEFTSQPGHPVGQAPTQDHLLVFFVPDKSEWEHRCAQMLAAGFQAVKSYNPFWDQQGGRTFEDVDGYRVVIHNSAWPF